MTDSSQTLTVPKSDWNGRAADMRSRLVTWEWHWKLSKGKSECIIDMSRVSFMEPWALAMFAAYALGMREAGYKVHAALDAGNPSNKYFAEMGFGEVCATGASTATTKQWRSSHQNTGLHVIRSHKDLMGFRASVDELTLHHCEDAADALRYALTELGRNVLQHSASPVGGVAIAQHFPDDQRLQLAMCDLGRGVRTSLQTRYPELQTDAEGLRLAVLPHASGAQPVAPYGDSLQNAGLGLFYSREIAWRAGGSFWMASGNALLGIRGDTEAASEDPPREPSRVYRKIIPWPGTIVVIDFPTDGILSFDGILRICGELADEARRLSGPAGLDFLGAHAETEHVYELRVAPFEEDTQEARRLQASELRPRIEKGEPVTIDFAQVRSPTQSFVHALLSDVFKIPGSLVRLSFLNCTPSAREVIKAVAAYASYRQIV